MLQGYVDSISPDKLLLTGWVQVGESGEHPVLSLDIQGKQTGKTVLGNERADVRAARGVANRAFTLTLGSPAESQNLLVNAHRVVAVADGATSFLPLGGLAYHQLMADFVRTAAAKVSGTREVILEALEVKELGLSKHFEEVRSSYEAGELSYLGFPVGLKSRDDVGQIGRDGHLFLTGGNNALRDQYSEPRDASAAAQLEAKAGMWASAIRASKDALDQLGIPFIQVVIPEKLTALRHLAPLPVSGPTPLYRRLNELMENESSYLDFLPMFESWSGDIGAWQRNDTHCSPAGSLAMTRSLLDWLPGCDPSLLDDVELTQTVYRNGDLSPKFFDIPLLDKQFMPAPGTLGDPDIEHAYSYTPGHFVGSHNIWTNASAPIKKKVVVFGNSFFGGISSPTRLGWWFSRLFSEYHMKWDAAVDMEYVKDVRPDFVIAQSIERFLVRPPGIPGTKESGVK